MDEMTVTRADVLAAFQAAQAAMCQLPEEEWPGWVMWLLEGHSDELLTQVHDELNRRLEAGRW